jgi:hypothetical protein
MSFAGFVVACWLGIAALAFAALSALTRLAARSDADADLGIVGETELRMLLGDRDEAHLSLDTRLAYLGIPGVRQSGGI